LASFNHFLLVPNTTAALPSPESNAGLFKLVSIPPFAPDTISDPVITAVPTYGKADPPPGAYDADRAYDDEVALEDDIALDALCAQDDVPIKDPVPLLQSNIVVEPEFKVLEL
jgi:hypothetical protein